MRLRIQNSAQRLWTPSFVSFVLVLWVAVNQSQNAKVLVSMLSRGGASAGVAGSSNALCAVKREGLPRRNRTP